MSKQVKLTRQAIFEGYRNEGHNQKHCAFLLGVTEKTACGFEKIRKAKKIKKLDQMDDLILRIKTRADKPETTVKELIELTYKLEDLVVKREFLVDQF